MTMLMHARHPFERAPSSMEKRDTIREGAAEAHLAMIKRFCISALTVLAAGGLYRRHHRTKGRNLFLGLSLLLTHAACSRVAIRDGSDQARNGW